MPETAGPSASQRPTLLHLPPDLDDFGRGDAAVGFAKDVGLDLYDWQAFCLRHMLARRRGDRNWSARDSVLEVPRQNGKNAILEALELYLVFLGGARLVVHSAHRVDTSAEHFIRLRSLIESSDDLMELMPKTQNRGFVTANGKEAIHLADGQRILFKTRTKTVGRGASPDAIVFDEAMVLDSATLGALTPSMSARRNAMLVFTGSSPMADSDQMWSLRRRALEGDGGRLFYAGWNSDPDVDLSDEDNWYACNPSLELGDDERPGKSIDAMRADLDLLDPVEFAREHLGVPEAPADTRQVIPLEQWRSLAVDGDRSPIVGPIRMAVDVSPDRKHATIAVAGRNAAGAYQVEIAEHGDGTAWVIGSLAGKQAVRDAGGVRVEKGGPAGSLVGTLREAGVEVVEVATEELKRATGMFIDAALSGELAHLDDRRLNAAVSGAKLRASGDAELWSRRSSNVDITPLVAATVALGGVPEKAPTPDPWVIIR